MSAKAIVLLCAQALLAQCALSQCTSRAAVTAAPALAAPGLASAYGLGLSGLAGPAYGLSGAGLGANCGGYTAQALEFSPTSGGALPVSSASASAPVGLSLASENAYEGALTVAGELPFVGTVGLEGVLPTSGYGAVNHACGNGINAIVSEGAAYPTAYGAAAIDPATGLGPAAAIAGNGVALAAPAIAGFTGSAIGYGAGPAIGYGAGPAIGYGAGLAGSALGYGAGLCGCGRGYAQ